MKVGSPPPLFYMEGGKVGMTSAPLLLGSESVFELQSGHEMNDDQLNLARHRLEEKREASNHEAQAKVASDKDGKTMATLPHSSREEGQRS